MTPDHPGDATLLHPKVYAELTAAGCVYSIRPHAACPFPISSPGDFARCLGRPLDAITKSLFLETGRPESARAFAIAVLPVTRKLDFVALARASASLRLQLASRARLGEMLGFPPTGVSPIGCAPFSVWIDESVFTHATVLVGGGAVGVELELTPAELLRVSRGVRLAFAASPRIEQ